MSNEYYEKILTGGLKELELTLKEDRVYLRSRPIPDLERVLFLLGTNYVRYIKALNQLIEAHDGLLHPNKRSLLQKVIEVTVGRILEIKHEMIKVDKSDFQYLDNIILKNKLTRKSVEIMLPSFCRLNRTKQLQKLEERINRIEELKSSLTF